MNVSRTTLPMCYDIRSHYVTNLDKVIMRRTVLHVTHSRLLLARVSGTRQIHYTLHQYYHNYTRLTASFSGQLG